VPLLGLPLLVLLAALAVGVLVTTFFLWVAATRAAMGAGRDPPEAVGACQLTAVLLVAAALNKYGYFYSSWSELLGRSSHSAQITAAPKTTRSAAVWPCQLEVAPP